MARILLSWELGSELGHLVRLQPLAAGLAGRGHDVLLAVREIDRAGTLLGDLPYVSCPTPRRRMQDAVRHTATFADLLFNSGAGDLTTLDGLCASWRSLFDLFRPDLVVMDYSPFALLATQGYPARTALVGTGFATPPPVSPLPVIQPGAAYADRTRMTEEQVLGNFNAQLKKQNAPALSFVGELFQRAGANLLATFQELDHYPTRENGDYCGVWTAAHGVPAQWPSAQRPRVFAYLKPIPTLGSIIGRLRQLEMPTLAYINALEERDVRRIDGGIFRLSDRPVAIPSLRGQCDLVICHAGHGTVAQMLLSGLPLLCLPQHGEQRLVAEAVERLGAGLMADTADPTAVVETLDRLLSEASFKKGAQVFAERYRACDPPTQVEPIIDRLHTLATQPS